MADITITGTKADIGLGNVDNTSDANKPVSTAQATAIAIVLSAITTHAARTDNPHSVTKSQVGLSNADNTSDANKPVSTAQSTAIGVVQTDIDTHEARTDNPHSVTKTQAGLGNVDNVQQQPIDSDLTDIAALSPSNDDIIQRKSGAWTNRTPTQYLVDLSAVLTSEIAVDTGAAVSHGTINTKIRRFATIRKQVGTDITYADSATLGASFTINVAGNYAITYIDTAAAATTYLGISVNSAQLTTAIYSITQANVLAYGEDGLNNKAAHCNVTIGLAVNDVIRPHTDGVPNQTIPISTMFTIKRVS